METPWTGDSNRDIRLNIESCYGVECLKCKYPCQFQECGLNVIKEKQDVLAIHNGKSDVQYLDTLIPGEDLDLEIYDCDNQKVPAKNVILDFVNKLAVLYLEQPRVFDALIRGIYNGETQSDIARSRGISRAAVSKELRLGVSNMLTRELGMRAPVVRRETLLNLTAREFAVYRALFVDGCSERSAASLLGIPKSTIHRMGQKIRSKLNKNGARKKPQNKKI